MVKFRQNNLNIIIPQFVNNKTIEASECLHINMINMKHLLDVNNISS